MGLILERDKNLIGNAEGGIHRLMVKNETKNQQMHTCFCACGDREWRYADNRFSNRA